MKPFRKKIYAAAGYNTIYFGSGRKEFNPDKPMQGFESYLKETAQGTCDQLKNIDFDEGVIGSFMSARFLKQANLPGFLPFMVRSLLGKPSQGLKEPVEQEAEPLPQLSKAFFPISPMQFLSLHLKFKIS